MSNRIQLCGLSMILPTGWLDVTDDLPDDSPPTLGKADGVGVIQFSTAMYKSGAHPNIGRSDLKQLLEEFGMTRHLGAPVESSEGDGPNILFVSGHFVRSDEQIGAWYISNGNDVALVTYVTLDPTSPRVREELRDASDLVASIAFETRG